MLPISEIEFLLNVISGNPEKGISESCNPVLVIKSAIRHKLITPLQAFAQHHPGFFNPDQMNELETRTRRIAVRSLQQLHEIIMLLGKMRDNKLQCITIKGPQLSRMLYGREALKDSVDLDLILLNGKDLPVVHTLLTEAGYTRSNLNDYPGTIRRKLFLIAKREVAYFNPETRITIDLHIRPGANTYLTEHRFQDFFQRLKTYDLEGTPVTILSDESYFVYLCYHGALHQFSRLAWLADIRAFLRLKGNTLKMQEITAIAGNWKVMHCVDLALLLISDYFREQYIPINFPATRRRKFLVSSCKKILYQKTGYEMTIPGRIHKIIYIQFLLEGVAARIDWFYGMMMRKLVSLLAKKI